MLGWRILRAVASRREVISCCIFGCGVWATTHALADEMLPVVVVGDDRDAACVRRLGGTAITVASPFAVDEEFGISDYDRGNTRALAVRQFSIYLVRTDAQCSRESVWRERLTRDNPHGRVLWIAPCGSSTDGQCRFAVERAFEVHRALTRAMPEHRLMLDANLEKELARLWRLYRNPVGLAVAGSFAE